MEHATGIGARIKARRLAKGLSAAALAARVGVTENAIRKIESGDSKEPRFSTGVRIAAALDVPAYKLVEESVAVGPMPPDLRKIRQQILASRESLADLGIAHVFVFGSVARGEATASSDIDIMVNPEPRKHFSLFDIGRAQQLLQGILGSPVDVVTSGTLARSRAGRTAKRDAVRVF